MPNDVDLALEELAAEVEQRQTVDDSVIALLDGLTAKLDEFADDPAKIREISAKVKAQREALAAKVPANTEEPPTT